MWNVKDLDVVVCDPNMDKNSKICSCLKALGVNHVVEVSLVEELIPTCIRLRPSVVILGDSFPGRSSLELFEDIQKELRLEGTPVLVHWKSSSPSTVRKLIASGVLGTIPFPSTVAGVKRTLEDCQRRISVQEAIEPMRKAWLFEGFTSRELRAFAEISIPQRFQPGETILYKDEPIDAFYVLLHGEVDAVITSASKEKVTVPIHPGRSFGEMAVLEGTAPCASCVARSEALVLEIDHRIALDPSFPLSAKIYAKLTQLLSRRLRQVNDMLQSEKNRTPLSHSSDEEKGGESIQKQDLDVSDLKKLLPENDSTVKEPKKDVFAKPNAKAEKIDQSIGNVDEYETLVNKVLSRQDFILNKIPQAIRKMVQNKLSSYWTGGKLARLNPQKLWSSDWFVPSSPRLKHELHLVVLCPNGLEAYQDSFLGISFSHRVVGLPTAGCRGTFLGSPSAINRYFLNQPLGRALEGDLATPIARRSEGGMVIQYLSHTSKDVQDDTLFVVFDDSKGKGTKQVREAFPQNQMVTIVSGYDSDFSSDQDIFTSPEKRLKKDGALVEKNQWTGEGFYLGETFFLPDTSYFFQNIEALRVHGWIFGTIGLLAAMGPDRSGVEWGSRGGADGAMKAARARYGIKGAQSAQDLAEAISWADDAL